MTVAPPLPNRRRKASSGPSKTLTDAPGDDSAPRHTGIRVTGDVPWGTHICTFYEAIQDLLNKPFLLLRSGIEEQRTLRVDSL